MTNLEWHIAFNALKTVHTLDSPARNRTPAEMMADGERFAHLREPDRIPTEAQKAAARARIASQGGRDDRDWNAATGREGQPMRPGQNQEY